MLGTASVSGLFLSLLQVPGFMPTLRQELYLNTRDMPLTCTWFGLYWAGSDVLYPEVHSPHSTLVP